MNLALFFHDVAFNLACGNFGMSMTTLFIFLCKHGWWMCSGFLGGMCCCCCCCCCLLLLLLFELFFVVCACRGCLNLVCNNDVGPLVTWG